LFEVRNLGDEPLLISQITTDDPHFIPDENPALPYEISALGTAILGVWFHPETAVHYNATLSLFSNDPDNNPFEVSVVGFGDDSEYPMGELLWQFTVDLGYDNSPKAIISLPDITGDGVDEVIVCPEDDYVRCLNGNSSGTADLLWIRELYSGAVYRQQCVSVSPDIDNDGFADVIVGTAWGDRSVWALSGKDGAIIWKHDTYEYGDGGWVYQVDCSFDYNGDDIPDILAATGDDANDLGPKRIYCLNVLNGQSIWECPTIGPVSSVIGIEDFTGDGQADVVAGASNNAETEGRVYGIDGSDGSIEWTFLTAGITVLALSQTDDVSGDGVPDVVAGDFGGHLYVLDMTDGSQLSVNSIGPYIITECEKLEDVNNNGHPDFAIGKSGNNAVVVDGMDVSNIWLHPLADYSWNVTQIDDISGDGINDVIAGTL
jgi:hypothetical protein